MQLTRVGVQGVRIDLGSMGHAAYSMERWTGPGELGVGLHRRSWYHGHMRPVEALYDGGLLRPTTPLALRPGERVGLIVLRLPDPSRWNLDRLSQFDRHEDLTLAEEGLAEWADALDAEDRG